MATPAFRQTVFISPRPDAPHLFWVEDPQTHRSYTFRDFEVSLARMLDGRRGLTDVVEAAKQVGIPLSDRGLDAFLGRLRAQGLLDEEGVGAPPYVAPWPLRASWNVATRELFRAALRAYRGGSSDQARAIVQQLLAQDPENTTARQLMEIIGKAPRPFTDVLAEAEGAWARAATEPAEPEVVPSEKRPTRLGPIAVFVALALLTAGLLFPRRHEISGKARLVPSSESEVKTAQSFFVGEVTVKLGDRVEQGGVLAKPDLAQLEPALKAAQEQLAASEAEVAALSRSPRVLHAQKIQPIVEEKVKQAEERVKQAEAKGGPALAFAQKQLAQMKEGQAQVMALARPAPLAAAEEKVKDGQARVAELKAAQSGPGLVSPIKGIVTKLSLPSGKELAAGTTVATIAAASQLKAQLELPESVKKSLAVGQSVQVDVSGVGKKDGKVTGIEPKPEATVDNADLTLLPGSEADATIDAGKRSTLARLLD